MSEQMLPCPFCGKEVDLENPDTLYPSGIYWRWDEDLKMRHYIRFKDKQIGDQPCWQLLCPETAGGCGVEIHGDTKEEVVAKWNKRV